MTCVFWSADWTLCHTPFSSNLGYNFNDGFGGLVAWNKCPYMAGVEAYGFPAKDGLWGLF